MFSPVSHVIFDLDGLILDTETIYNNAFAHAVEQCGGKYDIAWKSEHMGMSHDKAARTVLDLAGLQSVEIRSFLPPYFSFLHDHLPEAGVLPGVEKLIMHLNKHGIPMAICTGSGDDDFALKVRHHSWLTHVIPMSVRCSTDPAVTEGKPHPMCFQVTAGRFTPAAPTDKCLVFEDSPNGVTAALSAGMQCVMVPHPLHVPPRLRSATAVLSSIENFQPEQFGLPAY